MIYVISKPSLYNFWRSGVLIEGYSLPAEHFVHTRDEQAAGTGKEIFRQAIETQDLSDLAQRHGSLDRAEAGSPLRQVGADHSTFHNLFPIRMRRALQHVLTIRRDTYLVRQRGHALAGVLLGFIEQVKRIQRAGKAARMRFLQNHAPGHSEQQLLHILAH